MEKLIVDLIDDFKAYYAVYGVMLWEHNIPEVAAFMKKDLSDPTCNIGAFRSDGSRYEIYIPNVIERTRTSDFNIFYLRMSMITAITHLHDTLLQINRIDGTQELQFLKHLRNACAHGNRFYLKTGEPKKRAKFKSFEIESALDGFTPVLFDFIKPGDLFDLFDYIRALT